MKPEHKQWTQSLILSVLVFGVLAAGACMFVGQRLTGGLTRLRSHHKSMMEVSSEELLLHSSGDDCWIGLDSNVYDLSSYGAQHPGSPDLIYSYCGLVATSDFVKQHSLLLLRKVLFGVEGGQFDRSR